MAKGKNKDAVQALRLKVSGWTRILAAILAYVFLREIFKDTPLDKVTEAFDPSILNAIGLVIMFLAFEKGAEDDANIQEKILHDDPQKGEVDIKHIVGTGIFFASCISLFVWHREPVLFQAALLAFILINCWTFSVLIMGRLDAPIRETEKRALNRKPSPDWVMYMRLHLGVEYLTGNWQRRRFVILAIFAVLQLFVAAFMRFFEFEVPYGDMEINGARVDTLVQYIPSVLFLVYALISSFWMLFYRQRILSDLEALNLSGEHFALRKLDNIEPPEINYRNLFVRGRSTALQYR